MLRSLKYFSYLLVAILLLILGCVTYFYIATRPKTSGVISLPLLTDAVNIERDTYGIPHIEAKNDMDAFFALGYIHAQDRFWQMEFQRHIFQGTLSEMFGDVTIEQDKFLRTIGFYRAAKQAWPALSSHTQQLIHAYTNGVNAFLKNEALPLQLQLLRYHPKPWSDVDSIAWQKMMAWDLQNTWQEKITRQIIASSLGPAEISTLLPDYPKNARTVFDSQQTNDLNLTREILAETLKKTREINQFLHLGNQPGKGSNNWVVSGKLTESKKPLLASDPHLSFTAPNLWYLADIKTPNFHVTGATIPGLPAVIIGHNQSIAWGITNACVDAQDLYIEKDPTNFKVIEEIIYVKGKSPIHYTVRESQHGPLISDVSIAGKLNDAIALKWPALMPGDTTLQSFIELAYAKDWYAFQQALHHYVTPSQNFIYADTAGNIGYYLSGKIPIRDNWQGITPIASDQHLEWKGFIPFHQLPHMYNPSEGYIVTANNKITPGNYLFDLTPRCEVTHHRAERIAELIKNTPNLTIKDMARIQNDTANLVWRDLKPYLLATQPLDKPSASALRLLKDWNGYMSLDSHAASIFSLWFVKLSQLMPDHIREYSPWPSPYFIQQQLAENGKYCQLQTAKDCHEFLSQSLKQTVQELQTRFGRNEKGWQWGKIHQARFSDIGFGSVSYLGWIWHRNIVSAGDAFTVNVGTYDFNTLNQIAGASYRQIIDLNNFSQSWFIQALGQSDDVFNKNYSNQLLLWQKGAYIPVHLTSLNRNKLILIPETSD